MMALIARCGTDFIVDGSCQARGLTRLLGIILAALAVQFVLDGVLALMR